MIHFWCCVVADAPTVALSFGSNLDPGNIAEGNDVYFECKISANPEVYKVVWLHNVRNQYYWKNTNFDRIFALQDVMVLHDKSNGIIISGSSLVLQGVTRKHGGKYSCVASNIEGDTQSNILSLKVMCKFQKNQSKISQLNFSILVFFINFRLKVFSVWKLSKIK